MCIILSLNKFGRTTEYCEDFVIWRALPSHELRFHMMRLFAHDLWLYFFHIFVFAVWFSATFLRSVVIIIIFCCCRSFVRCCRRLISGRFAFPVHEISGKKAGELESYSLIRCDVASYFAFQMRKSCVFKRQYIGFHLLLSFSAQKLHR